MDMTALTASRHATQDNGPLRCVGHFNNAINFMTQNQQLLTLHREGRGLSPMGWEINSDDFDVISLVLQKSSACQLTPAGILLANVFLRKPIQRLNLHLTLTGKVSLSRVENILKQVRAETGLFGRLESAVSQGPKGELLQIQQMFARWLQGEAVNWDLILGKGPGLTPSNDDTVMGMLLCAWFDQRIDVTHLPPFFSVSHPLDKLTTLISLNYLKFAEKGIFSTPLKSLTYALLDNEKLCLVVNKILALGHTSGADTLLGVWLGTYVVNMLY